MKSADGEHLAELTAGQTYCREAGVEHDVINANDYEFVEVELKDRPLST